MARVLKPGGQAKFGPMFWFADLLSKFILEDSGIMETLKKLNVSVEKEFIPKFKGYLLKDERGFREPVDVFNVVLKKGPAQD